MNREELDRAAEAIATAEALVVGAGAGMGVDSGLPDFRGNAGFWKAYPAYRELGLDFASMANPAWFDSDPELAWGFYGHRLELYRRTRPHDGFGVLLRWASRMRYGAFVFTSNVDGQFQRAGFAEDRLYELHGAIDWMQCTRACGVGLFEAAPFQVQVDPKTFRAHGKLPACPRCGALARPNILMFGDFDWDESRASLQRRRFNAWLESVPHGRVAVVECGAGTAIPTVRRTSEVLADRLDGALVRVNVREPEAPPGAIGISAGALEALRAIDERVAAPAPGA